MRNLTSRSSESRPRQLGLGIVLAFAGFGAARVEATSTAVDFARDVRPVLSANCFKCHGPDEEQREADLRLDNRSNAVDDHAVIVPGDPESSEVWQRIVSDDPDLQMPPPDSGKQLSQEQRELLRRWIQQGAEWSEHWSFVAPIRPTVPVLDHDPWIRNPIDAFVLRRLKQEGLSPSPPADRATLLRRLSIDLIGLPPMIEELDRFTSDTSADAYQKQVSRLLASAHYGERWARWWLDAARYADSDGFEKDKPRQVWFYRDWVIRALNRDLPYDQFIIQQIAGDLLPNAGQDEYVATGFLRNSMINEEGGIDPEQFRMEAMFDRMDALGKGVLGLTIGCGQCHNHKYDPLSQSEYYQMFAFLNNCHEGQIAVYTEAERQQRERILAQIDAIDRQLQQHHADWPERLAAWELAQRQFPNIDWHVASLTFDDTTIGGQKFLPQPDGSYLAQGYAPTKFRPKMTLTTELKTITGIRLELLTDPNLPQGGPGRSIDGTCGLTEIEIEIAPASNPDQTQKVKIATATADVSPQRAPLKPTYGDRSDKQRFTGPVEYACDGDRLTAWTTDIGPGRSNQARTAAFAFDQPVSMPGGMIVHIYLVQEHGGWNSDDNQNYNLGRFRISVTDVPEPRAHPLPPAIRAVLDISPEQRTADQKREIFDCWRSSVPEWQAENERVEQLWREHPLGTTQLVLLERQSPRQTHRLERGNFLEPREPASPGVPDFLHTLDLESASEPPRLAFARWLSDRRSPTTARAIVNRVWQAHFGRGLVETSEDLGSQGALPTHPELLDWLAVEFMDQGWSVKALQRLIVSSSTYCQSSHISPESYERDPYNRLLARGARFRVDAEMVRDLALAASGLLSERVGGPSVYPPAPEFLFQPPASYGPKVWDYSTGGDRYRRSLYTFRFRSVPYPALQAFDAPNGDLACVRRTRSNTPLQALATLNETVFVECARALARRAVTRPDDTRRLQFVFRTCVARCATSAEQAYLLGMLHQQTERWSADGADPWQLAADDPDHPPHVPNGVTSAELAAWTVVSRVVLNLDETITRE